MKKVTPEQIERLYEFTHQCQVKYFDVQTELVDHLANAIETHWQEFPNDDFEIVLQKEFRKFGRLGFKKIVNQRKNQLTALYRRVVLQHFKTYFTFPKIFIPFCITICFFFLITHFLLNSSYVMFYWIGFYLVLVIPYAIVTRKIRRNILTNKKKILFQEIFTGNNSFTLWGCAIVVQIGNLLNLIYLKDFLKENLLMLWFTSLICSLALLFMHIVLYEILTSQKKRFEEIERNLIRK